MQVVPGLFTSGKVALKTQFFSNPVESVLFYSGMVTRKVKSGKRDFQDGATGRNSIAFSAVLCMWREKAGKSRGNKGLHCSCRSHLVQDPPLGKGKTIPRSFFIIQSPEMFYLRLKSFNFIKWLNNDVIIIEKSCCNELSLVVTSASWSFVVTRGHSCVLLDTIESNIFTSKFRSWQFLKTLGLIRLTCILSYTNQARKQQIPRLSRMQTAWQYNSQLGPDHMSRAGPVCQAG